MATVNQVLDASLKRIIVAGSESEINPQDALDFIFAMNIFMLDLDANGVNLGYTEVSQVSDQVTIPTGALRGVVTNMAIEISPDYGAPVSNELRVIAAAGLNTMRQLGLGLGKAFFPSTLPIGSGNEGEIGFNHNHFYPDQESEILAETTGCIGLETLTEET